MYEEKTLTNTKKKVSRLSTRQILDLNKYINRYYVQFGTFPVRDLAKAASLVLNFEITESNMRSNIAEAGVDWKEYKAPKKVRATHNKIRLLAKVLIDILEADSITIDTKRLKVLNDIAGEVEQLQLTETGAPS
jgi:hypothetical protein